MDEHLESEDRSVEDWVRSQYQRRLGYLWLLRYLKPGDNQPEISELEAKCYPDLLRAGGGTEALSQRDIDELQWLLGYIDGKEARIASAFVTKAVLFRLGPTRLVMRPEAKHRRPHFHIEYRNQYSASYAVDTLERLAGQMPRKYEDPMIYWASRRTQSLTLTWEQLNVGKDVRHLLLTAEEEQDIEL